MATITYTSEDGSAKFEINDSNWTGKLYDIENETNVVLSEYGGLGLTVAQIEDLDTLLASFPHEGFKAGQIMKAIGDWLADNLT